MQTIYSVSEEGVIATWEWVTGKPEDPRDVAGKALGVTAEFKKQRQRMAAARGQGQSNAAAKEDTPKVMEVEEEGDESSSSDDSDDDEESTSSSETEQDGERASANEPSAAVANVRRGMGPLDGVYAQEDSTLPLASFDYVGGYWRDGVKAFCNQGKGAAWAKVSRVHLNKEKNILLVTFTKGAFTIYEVPSFAALHSVSVGGGELDACNLTSDGEWVAVGCSSTSTLVVWEWQSESYILKQQGHHHGITCVAFSPAGTSTVGDLDVRGKSAEAGGAVGGGAGHVFATGGTDGKVKLWSSQTGFCFATFTEHTGPILDLCFTPRGNAVISASSDGTIRAFDLLRYRNFRTFASPDGHEQFASVAVDGGGEILLGATQGETPRIFVWSLQTGKLLETLAGHTSSISQLAFNPHPNAPGVFASASWDNTVRVWDIFGRMNKGGAPEAFEHTTMVASVAWDPRANRQFACATMGGSISIWDAQESDQLGEIPGLRDIRSGRKTNDRMPANNSKGQGKGKHVGGGVDTNQFFSSIAYAPTGQYLLAGSRNSPRVCVYDVDSRSSVRIVQLTHNWSLDGILIELNSKQLNDAGFTEADYQISDSEEEADKVALRASQRIKEAKALPGTKAGELANPKLKEILSVHKVAFSPDGREWAAATSHGVFTYAIDLLGKAGTGGAGGYVAGSGGASGMGFTPVLLTKNVSVLAVREAIERKQWGRALVTALALNDLPCLLSVFEGLPTEMVPLVVRGVSPQLLPALLNFLRVLLQPMPRGSVHFEAALRWLSTTMDAHLSILHDSSAIKRQSANDATSAAKKTDNGEDNKTISPAVTESAETSTRAAKRQEAEAKLQTALVGRNSALLDTRTLFLLILRQLQHTQNVLGRLLTNNQRLVTFLLQAGEAAQLQLGAKMAMLDADAKKDNKNSDGTKKEHTF